ncbi:MAG: hypothetical protein RR348_00585 [Clostridia bacterium]
MNNWWYVVIGLGVMFIFGVVLMIVDRGWVGWKLFLGLVLSIFSFVCLTCISVGVIELTAKSNSELSAFVQQKQYIEEVVPTLAVTDNYAITMKKIELNQWLFENKNIRKIYGNWCCVSKDIEEITPIK